MIAEAMCPICGAPVWLSTNDLQTAPMRAVCEDCETDPKVMEWWEEKKNAKTA